MTDKMTYFKNLITLQTKSNKSINSFCREEGISSGVFHYWKQKLNSLEDTSISLVPLTIENNIPYDDNIPDNNPCDDNISHPDNHFIKSYPLEINYPNGVILKLQPSLSKEDLILFITLLD